MSIRVSLLWSSASALDIIIFDPERYNDKSSIINPNRYPDGMEYVIVNGQIEIEKGQASPSIMALSSVEPDYKLIMNGYLCH
jgi:hypothetical protein